MCYGQLRAVGSSGDTNCSIANFSPASCQGFLSCFVPGTKAVILKACVSIASETHTHAQSVLTVAMPQQGQRTNLFWDHLTHCVLKILAAPHTYAAAFHILIALKPPICPSPVNPNTDLPQQASLVEMRSPSVKVSLRCGP